MGEAKGGWRRKQQEARSWAGPGVTHLPAGAHPELSAGWRATWCHLLGSCPGWWTPLALAPSPVLCDSRNACSPLGFTDPKEQNETGLLLPSNPFRPIPPTALLQQKEYDHLKDGATETPRGEVTCPRSRGESETKGRARALASRERSAVQGARVRSSPLTPVGPGQILPVSEPPFSGDLSKDSHMKIK